jgi:hypothetical protein
MCCFAAVSAATAPPAAAPALATYWYKHWRPVVQRACGAGSCSVPPCCTTLHFSAGTCHPCCWLGRQWCQGSDTTFFAAAIITLHRTCPCDCLETALGNMLVMSSHDERAGAHAAAHVRACLGACLAAAPNGESSAVHLPYPV